MCPPRYILSYAGIKDANDIFEICFMECGDSFPIDSECFNSFFVSFCQSLFLSFSAYQTWNECGFQVKLKDRERALCAGVQQFIHLDRTDRKISTVRFTVFAA